MAASPQSIPSLVSVTSTTVSFGRGVAPVGRAQVQSTDFIGQAGEGLLLGRPVGGGVAGVGVSKIHLGGCGGRRERDKGEAEPSEAS